MSGEAYYLIDLEGSSDSPGRGGGRRHPLSDKTQRRCGARTRTSAPFACSRTPAVQRGRIALSARWFGRYFDATSSMAHGEPPCPTLSFLPAPVLRAAGVCVRARCAGQTHTGAGGADNSRCAKAAACRSGRVWAPAAAQRGAQRLTKASSVLAVAPCAGCGLWRGRCAVVCSSRLARTECKGFRRVLPLTPRHLLADQ